MTLCTWLALILVTVGAILDLRDRQIPDWVPLGLLGTAVGAQAATCRATWLGAASWSHALLGAGMGLALGWIAFRAGVVGGADAKLTAALGACLGPIGLAVALAGAALCAGPMAWWSLHRGRPDFAAAPTLALGAGVALLVPLDRWLFFLR